MPIVHTAWGVVTGVAAVSLLVAGGAPAAAATQVACGDLVTSDLTLTADLSCPRTALELAPGVTLDLGGHVIRSDDGLGSGLGVLGPAHGSATIRNGTIRSAGTGIMGLNGALHVSHVTVEAVGVYGAGISAGRLTVEHSDVGGPEYGIWCSGCQIRDSRVFGGQYSVYGGATIERSVVGASWNGATGGIRIVDSVVRGEGTGVSGPATVIRTRFDVNGLGLDARGDTTVVASTFTGGDTGAIIAPGGRATVVGSLFVGNVVGLRATGDVTLRHNTAVGNAEADIDAPHARQDGWNVGVGSVARPPVPPSAPSPLCGTTLTVSTTLTQDAVCDQGVLLADGVTLDLAGHTLRGPGDGTGVRLAGAATVRGGTVRGWDVGVWSPPESSDDGLRLVGTTLEDNGVGVLAQSGTLRAEQVTWRHNTTGLRCDVTCTARGAVLTDHVAAAVDVTGAVEVRAGTLRAGGTGVLLSHASGTSTVADSTFFDNRTGVQSDRSALTAVRDVLRRNGTAVSVSDAPPPGEVASAPVSVELRWNLADGNGDGIVTTGTGVRLRGNVVSRGTGWGIHAPDGVDLGGNVAFGNGSSPQVVIGASR